MNKIEDRQLIRRLQVADDAAVHELAERYGPRILHLSLCHMKNREDAEEVAQDVLLKVHQNIGAFRGDSVLSSWIYRITFNTAMSRLRSRRLARAANQERARMERTDDGGDARPQREVADWSRLPDEELLRSQLRRAVAEAIEGLPEIYGEPVVLRDIHALTTHEASTRLRLKDQTLKSRLHRGRLMLREKLRTFSGGFSLHPPTPAMS
jgi:RNA polymerase sigma-70 factor (ECF subfamily)